MTNVTHNLWPAKEKVEVWFVTGLSKPPYNYLKSLDRVVELVNVDHLADDSFQASWATVLLQVRSGQGKILDKRLDRLPTTIPRSLERRDRILVVLGD